MPSSPPVLVAGAGPSGLVTALTLLRNGIPVRIISKEDTPRLGQRGPGIQPRTLELFHFLDVPQVLQTASVRIPIRTHEAGKLEADKTFYMSPYTEPTPAIPYYNPVTLGQQTLEGILHARLGEYGCHVESGTELRSFEQDGERVVAQIVRRVNGEEVSETVDASFLVGADGAKGITRKHLGLPFLGETRDDFRLIQGDIRMVASEIERDHWHWFGTFGTNMVMLRQTNEIGPDGFHFVLSSKEDYDVTKMANDTDLLMRCMCEITGAKLQLIELRWSSEYRPNVRMVDKFGAGRVFLVGGTLFCLALWKQPLPSNPVLDAAHVHSFTGGQGLNTSVQDALNIAWKIALVYKGLSSPELLETYSAERIPVITEMLGLTTELLNKATRSDQSSMQDALTRGKRLYMLGVNYRHSPIVVDEFSEPGPLNAYGDYHTVLLFGSDDGFVQSVVSGLKQYDERVIRTVVIVASSSAAMIPRGVVDEVLYDQEGHAHVAYVVESGQTRAVIVRPDGVVGAIVQGMKGVHKYFGKLFRSSPP
ncbi:hypothetical protein F5I97DRAFT_1972023 [Phlebopus sp. FC_14]|nr:hypothetical protein F5I97DRAFT_1972023 [Phlebopus sp. FC_14]